jgi:hypothetical protein
VKESRIGKDAVEVVGRKLKREKVLVPHLATAVLTGELDEAFGSFESDGLMAELAKNFQIAPGPATEIQNSRRFASDMFKKSVTILTHVVIFCPFPKTIRVFVVMT